MKPHTAVRLYDNHLIDSHLSASDHKIHADDIYYKSFLSGLIFEKMIDGKVSLRVRLKDSQKMFLNLATFNLKTLDDRKKIAEAVLELQGIMILHDDGQVYLPKDGKRVVSEKDGVSTVVVYVLSNFGLHHQNWKEKWFNDGIIEKGDLLVRFPSDQLELLNQLEIGVPIKTLELAADNGIQTKKFWSCSCL